MNKYSIVLTLCFITFFFNGFSQESGERMRHYFVPNKIFKEKYKTTDSLGFMIRDKDTLIEIVNYKAPKGVAVPYEYKDSTFLEYYKKIAFRTIHKDSADTKPMKYWKNPIKIYFSDSMDKGVIKDVMSFANLLDTKVDSLSISRVKKISKANYVIYYDDDFQFNQKIEHYKKSDYSIYWNGKNQINKGYIRIVRGKMFSNKLAAQKIKALFFGSLGWFKLSYELGCDSYFSNCYSDNKHFSEFDEALLKYHYSYGICKGTTRNTFEEQHKHAKEKLKDNHVKILFYHNY